MDERPDTGGEWIRLTDRRLSRLERRLGVGAAALGLVDNAVVLMREGAIPTGWEVEPDLAGQAPAGWDYVRRARAPQES